MYLSIIAALAIGAGPEGRRATWARSCGRSGWSSGTGRPTPLDPANDQRLKGALARALGKDGNLMLSKLDDFHGSRRPSRDSPGPTARSALRRVREAVEASVPESRKRLLPRIREHADRLTTSFDMIDEPHRLAGRKLADWIAENHRPGRRLDVIVVCTGNSRRSILGATMGNIAAAYYGMPEVRFHSGGTAPSAFNVRTVRALQGDRCRGRADRKGGDRGASRRPRIPSTGSGGARPAGRTRRRSKRSSSPSATTIPPIRGRASPP